MTNKTTSALTAATTPLAGTETLPIVQGGATVKVSVSALAASGINLTGPITSVGNATSVASQTGVGSTFVMSADPTISGNATLSTGNLVPATAGKGIDFSANTGTAGMTSELLNWYEEGTWTPDQGAGVTVVGAFSATGAYTRIGRKVTLTGGLVGGTSIACNAGSPLFSNAPFTSNGTATGTAVNGSITISSGTVIGGTTLYLAEALAASPRIFFAVTYIV